MTFCMKKWEGFEHGINFGGWLSQCDYSKDRLNNFITEKDFETVKGWGLDHIRIPVDYNIIQDDEFNFNNEGFGYIDFAIDMCRKYGLNMILDIHKTPGYSFDPFHNEVGFFADEKYQVNFYKIWEELAKRYGKYSNMLAFELLNEITKKEYCDPWNRISTECIKTIRKYAPDIKILVGGYYNNSAEAVKDLLMPYDENIVYNFHFYEPLLFTHQGAPWIATMDTEFRCPFDMTYDEYEQLSDKYLCQAYASFKQFGDMNQKPNEEYFFKLLKEAVETAEERNVPLYCGEYGVIDRVNPKEAVKWFREFHNMLKHNNIGSAIWSYKEMDFGISDKRMDDVRDELIDILLHKCEE